MTGGPLGRQVPRERGGKVGREGDEVGVRLGGKGSIEPVFQLIVVDAALPGRLTQDLGDLLALLVGDALLGGLHQPHRDSSCMGSG